MYKLYSIQMQDSSGQWHDEWSSDGTGHMAVQITPKGDEHFGCKLSEKERIDEKKVDVYINGLSGEEAKAASKEFLFNYTKTGLHKTIMTSV